MGYAEYGLTSYLLSVPLGLLAAASLSDYLERGGRGRWFRAAAACVAVFLVHVTSPMLVAPAGMMAYGVTLVRARREGRRLPAWRHFGFWAIAPVVLLANAFWWVPWARLASTKGAGALAFSHPESVLVRIGEIFWEEVPIQAVVLGLGPSGLVTLARRDAVAASGLAGFLAAGFSWGYLAGFFRALDPLQPGWHTLGLFTAACVAAGISLDEILARLHSDRDGRLSRWLATGPILIGIRLFGSPPYQSLHARLGAPEPFLSSRPPSLLLWLVDRTRKYVGPGERLLYEETGLAVPWLIDPFQVCHYSPVLPGTTGVEVLGGPLLHATVTTNFTQFGEGKFFGHADWGRDEFARHARLYRPAAIACWSPRARAFCRNNPDLIRVVEDGGVVIIGRVLGFEGGTIRGQAEVKAIPGRGSRSATPSPGSEGWS